MSGTERLTLRQLAAEAGLTVADAKAHLEAAGVSAAGKNRRFAGRELGFARRTLGLASRAGGVQSLSESQLRARILRPLLTKGKVGRNHTTAIENVYGHGIPDHQKDEARALMETLIAEGFLDEKTSQGRRHVWLTPAGRALCGELDGEA